jgi:hypothetical protein|tara:strand:- start:7969 stop:8178 length:210 start_codon:yes stop_codon:yes gene_type:complete
MDNQPLEIWVLIAIACVMCYYLGKRERNQNIGSTIDHLCQQGYLRYRREGTEIILLKWREEESKNGESK